MLTTLRIADFAIIQASELHLHGGFTALTGETGAGKSILIDALELVLGGRGAEKSIRSGAEQTEVEALFEDVGSPELQALLHDAGVDGDGETLILRRIHTRAGRSRCHVNGRLVTQAQLKAIAAPLCDLSSQHAQHRLLDPAFQLEVLDRFAGLYAGAEPLRPRYDRAFHGWRQAAQRRQALADEQKARADRLDWLRFVHEELATLQLEPGETERLSQELARLRAAEQIARTLAEAAQRCEDEQGIRDQAVRVARAVGKLAHLDPKLAALAERADELAALAEELARDLGQAARHVERDDRRMARLAERQDTLLRAIRKHGGTEAALLERRDAVARELDADRSELELIEAERAEKQAADVVRALAEELRVRRLEHAPALAGQIAGTVRRLGMPAADVRIDLRPRSGAQTDALRGLGPAGGDALDVLLRANKGEGEGTLATVASGGELSRVLLAVRRASLSRADGLRPPLAVYDEVDAGLSGSTGLVLGQYLREVGQRQQVLAITHLPQVAAAADHHVRVHKAESAERTMSHLQQLDGPGRLDEIARMLGAAGQTRETALEHARKLLAGHDRDDA